MPLVRTSSQMPWSRLSQGNGSLISSVLLYRYKGGNWLLSIETDNRSLFIKITNMSGLSIKISDLQFNTANHSSQPVRVQLIKNCISIGRGLLFRIIRSLEKAARWIHSNQHTQTNAHTHTTRVNGRRYAEINNEAKHTACAAIQPRGVGRNIYNRGGINITFHASAN